MLPLLLLIACGDKETENTTDTGTEDSAIETEKTDNDGDGVSVEDGDCDDDDATVYPGAEDVWDDGIDQDCDGEDMTEYLSVCADAVPCPDKTDIYSTIEEWEALANCSSIPGTLDFDFNQDVTEIPANCLRDVGGDILFENTARLVSDLSSIDNLKWLRSVNRLSFDDISTLQHLPAFEYLESIGALSIHEMRFLTEISGFERLTTADQIYIDDLPRLTDISGFNALTNLNSFYLNQTGIKHFSGFEEVRSVGNFSVIDAELESLSAFSNLLKVEEGFLLWSIDAGSGVSVNDFVPRLKEVEGVFKITSAKNTETIDGFNELTSIGGTLEFKYNSMLESITGFAKLRSVHQYYELDEMFGIILRDNELLTDLSGLSSIQTTQGISISEMASLTNLNDFSGLTGIPKWLRLADNAVLSNISFLEQTGKPSRSLIYDNPSLCTSHIENVFNTIGASMNPPSEIYNNDDGC